MFALPLAAQSPPSLAQELRTNRLSPLLWFAKLYLDLRLSLSSHLLSI
jgi:hypothetical protein